MARGWRPEACMWGKRGRQTGGSRAQLASARVPALATRGVSAAWLRGCCFNWEVGLALLGHGAPSRERRAAYRRRCRMGLLSVPKGVGAALEGGRTLFNNAQSAGDQTAAGSPDRINRTGQAVALSAPPPSPSA